MLDHLALQCADVDAAAFYPRLRRVRRPEAMRFDTRRAGRRAQRPDGFPQLWFGPLEARAPAGAPGPHRAVRERSTRSSPRPGGGAEILHEPGQRPEYHPGYYGVFFRDPDGNNVEAVHHGFPPDGPREPAVVDQRRRLPGLSALVPGLRRRRHR